MHTYTYMCTHAHMYVCTNAHTHMIPLPSRSDLSDNWVLGPSSLPCCSGADAHLGVFHSCEDEK